MIKFLAGINMKLLAFFSILATVALVSAATYTPVPWYFPNQGQPNFKAFVSSDITSYTSGSAIIYDNKTTAGYAWDTNGAYSTSTGHFLPTIAGKYYCFSNNILTGTALVGSTATTEILKQGSGGFGIVGGSVLPAVTTASLGVSSASGYIFMNGTTDYVVVSTTFAGTITSATVKSASSFGCALVAL